ncbi:transposase [Kitasatospora sp. NPDC051984]|uniref:transposase n=1 Tax=Kitasatospora sp. NPDC051984 TaxID=3364059 RepID=UPI0037CC006C
MFIHDLLRRQVRERRGRSADPSLIVLDTQSLYAALASPPTPPAADAHKKVPGRKRGLAVDVLGLVIAVVVPATSAHDNAVGIALVDKVAADTDTVKKTLVDQGFNPPSGVPAVEPDLTAGPVAVGEFGRQAVGERVAAAHHHVPAGLRRRAGGGAGTGQRDGAVAVRGTGWGAHPGSLLTRPPQVSSRARFVDDPSH